MNLSVVKTVCMVLFLGMMGTAYAQPATDDDLAHFPYQVPRLSPVPSVVEGVKNCLISLNGEWDFAISQRQAGTILVPGEWEMQGYFVKEGEVAIYHRRFSVPEDWKGKRVKIRFDAVSSYAQVKVNGTTVGEHEGSFVPFELDITDHVVFNDDNQLEVEVRALTISDRMAALSQYAAHTVGGILRKVNLFVLPGTNLSDQFVTTTFDADYRDAELHLTSTLTNESGRLESVQLNYILKDPSNKVILSQKVVVEGDVSPNGAIEVKKAFKVSNPKHWNPEQPYLYHLTTQLWVNHQKVQEVYRKTGFRQIEVSANQLLVNGKPVKLRGVNRHVVHPLTGRSLSPEWCRKDAELFKQANCNYIRTSHYPPSEEFLHAADEMGLMVENEASLNWIQHHASPIWRKWDYQDVQYLPYMLQANIERISAAKNHPSVIIWSIANESRWSPLWARVNQVVKELDPSRPTSFHDQCWGGFNNAGSKADIAVYHYPDAHGPAKCDENTQRPTLFGEYDHLACYNRRELVTDPGIRSAYGPVLTQMYDSIYAHTGCLGGAIWSGIDDTFYMPDGRIVGYGPWGPIDGWRRPKPEYWGMKKAYSPVRVLNVDQPQVKRGQLILQVENRYDFTNLKQLKIVAKVDGKEKAVKADILPRAKGQIKIPVELQSNELYVSFTDASGMLVNEELIQLKPATSSLVSDGNESLTISEKQLAYHIHSDKRRYIISKETGIITAAFVNNELLLEQGPVFGIIHMNSDNGGKPNVANSTYQNNIHPIKDYPFYTLFAKNLTLNKQDNGDVLVHMEVYFNEGSGEQSYLFKTNGTVEVHYKVRNGKDHVKPRQYGMIFQLPKSMDRLSWERDGAFSTYPEYDVSRNKGTAVLNAQHLAIVEPIGKEPQQHWKDEANDLGSRDFRATRTNIKWVSLQNKLDKGVLILSGGRQAARSWLQDERIQLLVADYSNTGGEPFYGGLYTQDRITIAKDQMIEGKLVFYLY
jgi:hypothetical protein